MLNYIYVEFGGMCIAFEDYLGSVVDLTVWNAVLSAMGCKAELVKQVFQLKTESDTGKSLNTIQISSF